MDLTHIYELHKLLSARRYPIPKQDILDQLEWSNSKFYRVHEYMHDYLGSPIKTVRGQGYIYDVKADEQYELPGLWFSAKEIIALGIIEQLSESFQPQIIKQLLDPFKSRINTLLKQQQLPETNWQLRIKIISQWQRPCEPEFFTQVAYALLHRKQLQIDYWQWHSNTCQQRIISPQRLVYYRDNWYLDAWCHLRQALRTFSVDAIRQIDLTDLHANDVDAKVLNDHVMDGYGIFSGEVVGHAILKFSKHMSNRVSRENWHPDQTFEWTLTGEYLLTIPYSEQHELLRDILRYGVDVEVLSPKSLKNSVKDELTRTLEKYI
jgi:predicted DNA-binding transcriptional regulator YafY